MRLYEAVPPLGRLIFAYPNDGLNYQRYTLSVPSNVVDFSSCLPRSQIYKLSLWILDIPETVALLTNKAKKNCLLIQFSVSQTIVDRLCHIPKQGGNKNVNKKQTKTKQIYTFVHEEFFSMKTTEDEHGTTSKSALLTPLGSEAPIALASGPSA